MKVVDRYWKGNKIWGVTIRVSRYLDKFLKKMGLRVNFHLHAFA